MCSHCGPCVLVSIGVHNRQDVDIHVVQDVRNVLVYLVKCQRLCKTNTRKMILALDQSNPCTAKDSPHTIDTTLKGTHILYKP